MVGDRSKLLNLLFTNGRVGEAAKIAISWLGKGIKPSIKTLNVLVNYLAKAGDLETLNVIGNLLDKVRNAYNCFYSKTLSMCLIITVVLLINVIIVCANTFLVKQ